MDCLQVQLYMQILTKICNCVNGKNYQKSFKTEILLVLHVFE